MLPFNANRTYAVLCNDGSADCYLGLGQAAVAHKGPFLKAGVGTYEINADNLTKVAIFAICKSGESTTLSIQESQ